MTAASEQVFDTVELLETILFELPTRGLLLSQRVCEQWNAVITASKKLQEALFFRPLEGRHGPLLVEGDEKGQIYGKTDRGHGKMHCTYLRNPLIDQLLHELEPEKGVHKSATQFLPDSWRRPEASWRLMYPFHPSTDVRAVYYKQADWADHDWIELDSDDSYPMLGRFAFETSKIRLGELMDEVDRTLRKVEDAFIKLELVVDELVETDEPGEPLHVLDLPPLKDNSQLQELKSKLGDINK